MSKKKKDIEIISTFANCGFLVRSLSKNTETKLNNSKKMIESKEKDFQTIDLFNYFQLLLKYKYWIGGLVILSVALTLFFTSPLFIKPLYKSTVAFYPNSISSKSDESPSKQVLFWSKSQDIKDSIIEKYNYRERYNLPNKSSLYRKYNENIKATLDKYYGNVTIEVMDVDCQIACQIANDIIYFLNKKIDNDIKRPYLVNLIAYKKAIDKKNEDIDSTIQRLIAYGVDYEIIMQTLQGIEVTKGYLGTSESSHAVNKEAVRKMKTNIEEKGPFVTALQQELYALISQRSDLQSKYDGANVVVMKEHDLLSIVSPPVVNSSKVYPRTLRTTILIAVLTLILSSLFVICLEKKHFHSMFKGVFKSKTTKKSHKK